MNTRTTNESTQDEHSQDGGPPRYISPVLASLDAQSRPEPSPACETCPASVWFTTSELLKCFCGRMHLIVWDATEAPILRCDGRELAIIALRETRSE